MKQIIIFYPKQFNCYSKFQRKVLKILGNLDDYSVVYTDDPNGFIVKLFNEELPSVNLTLSQEWEDIEITHGIVFDDGEELSDEELILKNKSIPLRLIKIDVTRVINLKKETKYSSEKSTQKYEYIGRGSYWGNPYSMYEEGDSRDEVIRKYKYDFDFEKFPNKEKSEVYKLAGKRLGCFCKPHTCHGDVLADFLNAWDDGK